MTVIKTSLFHVLEKFPDRGEYIRQLFNENREFQIVCDDYRQCAEALQHWNQSNDKSAPARRQEYASLLQELADEIREWRNMPAQ